MNLLATYGSESDEESEQNDTSNPHTLVGSHPQSVATLKRTRTQRDAADTSSAAGHRKRHKEKKKKKKKDKKKRNLTQSMPKLPSKVLSLFTDSG